MPFNGTGTFTRVANWVLNAAQNINILPDLMDADTNDIAAGLSQCITRDGQGVPTADIPWNNFGITGLRAPVLGTDAAHKTYVDNATGNRSMGGYKITNLADPTLPQDAATRQYVLTVSMNSALPFQPGGATPYFLTTLNGVAAWTTNPTPDFLLMNQGVY